MAADATSSVYSQNLKGDLNAPYINAENVQSNMKVIYYSRTFMSIVGGIIAGILGFTGLTGFIFYFLVMAVTSVGLTAKSFVLFWTFAYDIVHIF
ncbi:ER membrane protein complex subunit 6-like isoform X2 [Chenopodium quinoa]|uniref:ER membrane protein complex subunit 6-like isoform X2 n=1 Tax=Chenopodium quinoa TaxID=63459 RepID=UPI000B7752E5|nr:ER membrane protein complex subunit 6-like isoform X2 [Chenopodium quinoa]